MARIPHSRPVFGPEEEDAVARVLRSGHVAQGPEVEAFESECAAFAGRAHGVAVSSGTAAIHLVLDALDAHKEPVTLPSYGCAALVTAVHAAGAVPVLADVDGAFQIVHETSPTETGMTIVPHLFGGTAPVPDSGVVIEDIAQSFGGETGRAGVAAVMSFYATKLMSTGEGGMVLTDDAALAERVRDRRDYDNREEYARRYSYKMTDVQAAMGRVQLTRLPGFLERRRTLAAQYTDGLRGLPLGLPEAARQVVFRYVVTTERRGDLEAHLNENGIEAKRPVYRPAHQYFRGDAPAVPVVLAEAYPGSDAAHATALSLPLNPALEDADIGAVVDCIRRYFD